MKITGAKLYTVPIPLIGHAEVKMGGLDRGEAMVSLLVKLETDEDISGWGEFGYFWEQLEQVIVVLGKLVPRLVGQDPTEIGKINELMDNICPHVSYAKSVVDIACWDIFGKVCKQPIYQLFGGKRQESVPLMFCAWPDTPENQQKAILRGKMDGYQMFQCKIGSNPEENAKCVKACREVLDKEDILAVDANGGMTNYQATRTLELLKDVDFIMEQPCATVNACEQVCRQAGRAVKLDENIPDIHAVIKSFEDKFGDILTLKIGRIGGLTKTRQMRDLAVSLDRCINVECHAGLEVITAAIAHLAISTPPAHFFATYDLSYYHEASIGSGLPPSKNGKLHCPEGPGLGITVDEKKLGEPVLVI